MSKEAFQGNVLIRLLSASDLKKYKNKCNPQILVSLGKYRKFSKFVENNTNPTFNDIVTFKAVSFKVLKDTDKVVFLSKSKDEFFSFNVDVFNYYEDVSWKELDVLGSCEVQFSDIYHDKVNRFELDLDPQGKLKLEIVLIATDCNLLDLYDRGLMSEFSNVKAPKFYFGRNMFDSSGVTNKKVHIEGTLDWKISDGLEIDLSKESQFAGLEYEIEFHYDKNGVVKGQCEYTKGVEWSNLKQYYRYTVVGEFKDKQVELIVIEFDKQYYKRTFLLTGKIYGKKFSDGKWTLVHHSKRSNFEEDYAVSRSGHVKITSSEL